MTPLYLVFMGPPGSGKGTQADILRDKLGLAHVSSGDLFREQIARGTALGQQVKAILASGALVPDDLTVAIVMERLHQPDTSSGVVLDGFPRTPGQAEALERELQREGKQINRAIYFHVADGVIVDRLAARWICPQDKQVYNLKSKPPKHGLVCDDDGTPLIQRDDDQPEIVRARLQVYREQTAPVLKFYRDRGVLLELDAAQAIDVLESQLEQVVGSF